MMFSTQMLERVTADRETEENFRTFCSTNLEICLSDEYFYTHQKRDNVKCLIKYLKLSRNTVNYA